uniref:Cyclin-dependent kinases regulatory subunit n=1 Tax=Calidris pygmaea TaxID=425635 RepID=A0A8C3PSR7_9CHAR
MANKQIYYSNKYFDEKYEYRHVMLPRELSKQVPKTHLMSEEEWRRLGVQHSIGWCVSRCRQDIGTTTKPWIKGKEQFNVNTSWIREPLKQHPGRGRQAGNAGTAEPESLLA